MAFIYYPPSGGGADVLSAAATGSIQYLVSGMGLPFGDEGFTLTDSLGVEAEFFWSMGGGGDPLPGAISTSGGPDAETMASRTVTAINDYPGLAITAVLDGDDDTLVLLTQDIAGEDGNGSIELSFTLDGETPELAVVDFAGGSGALPSLTAGTGLRRDQNLSDVDNVVTARNNLGLGYLEVTGFHTFVVGTPVWLSGGSWSKAYADTPGGCRNMIGVVAAIDGSDGFSVALPGQTFTMSGAANRAVYYVAPFGGDGSDLPSASEPATVGWGVKIAFFGVAEDLVMVAGGDTYIIPA